MLHACALRAAAACEAPVPAQHPAAPPAGRRAEHAAATPARGPAARTHAQPRVNANRDRPRDRVAGGVATARGDLVRARRERMREARLAVLFLPALAEVLAHREIAGLRLGAVSEVPVHL